MPKGYPLAGGAQSGWTDERTELAKTMWLAGASADVVAIALNSQPGFAPVSRNAVIGRMHRIGLKDSVRATLPRPSRAPRPAAVAPAPRMVQRLTNHGNRFDRVEVMAPVAIPSNDADRDAVHDGAARLTIADLSNKICRWPIGDVGDPRFTFCGAHTRTPPYCAHHTRIACAAPAARRVPGGFVSPQSKVTGGY